MHKIVLKDRVRPGALKERVRPGALKDRVRSGPSTRTACVSAVALLSLCGLLRGAEAHEFNDQAEVFGYGQFWFTLHEQVEEADELYQSPSRDPAATSASGLSINRARLGARLRLLEGSLRLFVQLKLERDPSLLDLALWVRLARWLELGIGQQKIPSTYENLTPGHQLDFIQRSLFSRKVADFSLSRTTFASSLFYGVRSNLRDLGLSLRGLLDLGPLRLSYLAMLGNGLGANLFIGGGTQKEFIITNPGDFFYGARLELSLPGVVTLGGHINHNRHDNMVYNSGRVVFDLDRLSASGDLQLTIPGTGIRLGGLFGWGEIDDDFDDDGRTDLKYWGGEARLLWILNPLLQRISWSDLLRRHQLGLGARYDNFSSIWNGAGATVREHTVTAGISYRYDPHIKVQLEYMLRRTDDPDQADLADDALILSVQGYL